MKLPHPAYFYNLFFKITMPKLQALISELEHEVLEWTGITTSIHPMGGVAFRLNRKEIGHVHWNGDLDIVLGRNLTEKLLKIEGIRQHRFVPDAAITFPLRQQEDLAFGIALLRFSYIIKLDKLRGGMSEMEDFIAEEVGRLPNTLRQLYLNDALRR